MSTIQNLKNFIRHGKQARTANQPHAEPTTETSNVHAHQHSSPARNQQQPYAASDPNVLQHQPLQGGGAAGHDHGYSAAAVNNQNQAAQAGNEAARAQEQHQKKQAAKGDVDPSVLERIVAEERESKGKLPKYPGLERWTLLEKMGDGAFSNVYRAKDNTGQFGEAAIKVVRKFEMNSSQVSNLLPLCGPPSLYSSAPSMERNLANSPLRLRATTYSIPTSRKRPKPWRCDTLLPLLIVFLISLRH